MTRRLTRLALAAITLILFTTSCQGQLETVPPTPLPTREPLGQAARPTQITPTEPLPTATLVEQVPSLTLVASDTDRKSVV